jgi:hypothetical protein
MQKEVSDKVKHNIAVMFDIHDPKQVALLHAFAASFGARYAKIEDADCLRHWCLLVYPGGARDVRR